MVVRVVVPPDQEPVSLEEAKAHLRVDGNHDDALIAALITAAREYAEGYQQRAFVTQTLELTLDCFPASGEIELPRPPIQRVESITCTLADGSTMTVDPDTYLLDAPSGRLALAYGASWPNVTLAPIGGVTIRYVAGYGDPSKVPAKVKQAILLIVGHWYANREDAVVGTVITRLPMAAEALLWQDRLLR
ncbi:head-tail connector protein [Symbiobacterium thermophilum]|uniref:Phage gp6-like head-tail connector protein n=1 Tax=Symbiobacterium thermophilum TaxID=2734 RepID=A0A953I6L4_SYMTR|nr:head-tail connector protein [Symbiobacterium thermophilum]MBY6275383.1 hypothetical protein [Symbiobacterium thermophilum]